MSLLRVGRELPAMQRLRRRLLLLRRVPKVALENSSPRLYNFVDNKNCYVKT